MHESIYFIVLALQGALIPFGQAVAPAGPSGANEIWSSAVISPVHGRTAVAWSGGGNVLLRILDKALQPISPMQSVNTVTISGTQDEPHPCWSADGELILIAFNDRNANWTQSMQILGAIFDKEGREITAEFVVPDPQGWRPDETKWRPRVEALPGGGWAVGYTTGFGARVAFQVVRADGSRGPEILVSGPTVAQQESIELVAWPVGRLSAVWIARNNTPIRLKARTFDLGTWAPVGPEVVLATGAGDSREPRLARGPQGQVWLCWQQAGVDGASHGVRAALASSTWTWVVPPFTVNQTTIGAQQDPQLWTSSDAVTIAFDDRQGMLRNMRARIFDASDGHPLSAEVLIAPNVGAIAPSAQGPCYVSGWKGGRFLLFGWQAFNAQGNSDIWVRKFEWQP